jgi:uncharacterized protein YigA (DUF484 family)
MDLSKRIKNTTPKGRKAKKGGSTLPSMPKSVTLEVRRIRNEMSELEQEFERLAARANEDRGTDRSYSRTEHSTECSLCGEVGSHYCLPIMHQMLEDSEEFQEATWRVFQEMDRQGFFREESGASKELNLGVW